MFDLITNIAKRDEMRHLTFREAAHEAGSIFDAIR